MSASLQNAGPTGGPWLRDEAWDVALYGGSVVVAAGCLVSHLPPVRAWGTMALPAYLIALWLSAAGSRRRPADTGVTAARRAAMVVALAGAAAGPLVAMVALREVAGPTWAQSEVLVVEQAADTLLHGHSPYGHVFVADLLTDRPLANAHFPYLPLMMAFGLARSLAVVPPTDARVLFTGFAVVVAVVALVRSDLIAPARFRIVQVMFTAPFGALAAATGGDDLPVLALLLLGTTQLAAGRNGRGWLAIGCAALTKATAWPLVLALVVMRGGPLVPARLGTTRTALLLGMSGGGLLMVPPQLWHDTVLFPAGLTDDRSPAATPTAGRLLVHLAPDSARTGRMVVLAVAAAVVVTWAVVCRLRAPATLDTALLAASCLFLAFVVLSPVSRPGYLAYPLNMLCWRWAVTATVRGPATATPRELREAPA